MLVTTAMMGERRRKVPSLSSASATRNSPCPRRALVPSARTVPPTTTVGSRAETRQPPCRLALHHVRTGDDVAEREQHLRDAAHTDATDADEVDPALAPVHRRAPRTGQPEPPAPVPDPALKPHHARTLLEN